MFKTMRRHNRESTIASCDSFDTCHPAKKELRRDVLHAIPSLTSSQACTTTDEVEDVLIPPHKETTSLLHSVHTGEEEEEQQQQKTTISIVDALGESHEPMCGGHAAAAAAASNMAHAMTCFGPVPTKSIPIDAHRRYCCCCCCCEEEVNVCPHSVTSSLAMDDVLSPTPHMVQDDSHTLPPPAARPLPPHPHIHDLLAHSHSHVHLHSHHHRIVPHAHEAKLTAHEPHILTGSPTGSVPLTASICSSVYNSLPSTAAQRDSVPPERLTGGCSAAEEDGKEDMTVRVTGGHCSVRTRTDEDGVHNEKADIQQHDSYFNYNRNNSNSNSNHNTNDTNNVDINHDIPSLSSMCSSDIRNEVATIDHQDHDHGGRSSRGTSQASTLQTKSKGLSRCRARMRGMNIPAFDLDLVEKSQDSHTMLEGICNAAQCYPLSKITRYLYIGTWRDACDVELLRRHHITFVLNVAAEVDCCASGARTRIRTSTAAPEMMSSSLDFSQTNNSNNNGMSQTWYKDEDAAEMSPPPPALHSVPTCTNSTTPFSSSSSVAPEIHYTSIPMKDCHNEELITHFEQAFRIIEEARRQHTCALVHCRRGISRSAAIVIAYLMATGNRSYECAFQHVLQRRHCISLNLAFHEALSEYKPDASLRHVHPVPHTRGRDDALAMKRSASSHPVRPGHHARLEHPRHDRAHALCGDDAMQDTTGATYSMSSYSAANRILPSSSSSCHVHKEVRITTNIRPVHTNTNNNNNDDKESYTCSNTQDNVHRRPSSTRRSGSISSSSNSIHTSSCNHTPDAPLHATVLTHTPSAESSYAPRAHALSSAPYETPQTVTDSPAIIASLSSPSHPHPHTRQYSQSKKMQQEDAKGREEAQEELADGFEGRAKGGGGGSQKDSRRMSRRVHVVDSPSPAHTTNTLTMTTLGHPVCEAVASWADEWRLHANSSSSSGGGGGSAAAVGRAVSSNRGRCDASAQAEQWIAAPAQCDDHVDPSLSFSSTNSASSCSSLPWRTCPGKEEHGDELSSSKEVHEEEPTKMNKEMIRNAGCGSHVSTRGSAKVGNTESSSTWVSAFYNAVNEMERYSAASQTVEITTTITTTSTARARAAARTPTPTTTTRTRASSVHMISSSPSSASPRVAVDRCDTCVVTNASLARAGVDVAEEEASQPPGMRAADADADADRCVFASSPSPSAPLAASGSAEGATAWMSASPPSPKRGASSTSMRGSYGELYDRSCV